jgi:vacuolar-type H+-ATPase subunit I/STV1
LEKYVAVKNPKSTNAMEKLMDMVGIPEEKRPANKKH